MSQVLTEQYTLALVSTPANATLGLTNVDEAMEFNHRIKIWELVIDLYQSAVPEAYNGTYQFGLGEFGLGGGTPAYPTEREICTIKDQLLPYLFLANLDNIPAVFVFTLRFGHNLYVGTTADVQTSWELGFELEYGNLYSKDFFGGAPLISAATMTVRSLAADLYEPVHAGPFVGYTGSITLNPIEWWEYAPTSGGLPVFDSATGAQINPNVVID